MKKVKYLLNFKIAEKTRLFLLPESVSQSGATTSTKHS